MKTTTSFVCQECGYDTPKFLGKCPECNAWNSLKEIRLQNQKSIIGNQKISSMVRPKTITEIVDTAKKRISTDFSEMDNVLGGGIVNGSVVLLAGDPGIGKSTLLLQVALNIAQRVFISAEVANENFFVHRAKKGVSAKTITNPANAHSKNFVSPPHKNTVLYISGEESEEQIKMRANRISKLKVQSENFLILSSTDTDSIISSIQDVKPSLVIVDSIQTIESENLEGLAGAIGQVRYAAFSLIKVAKTLNIPIIIVGHVTKEGMVAGPMILSHMVDAVLFLEGEKFTKTRILRSLKNRFGPVDEVGVFTMEEKGMSEVKNPEQIFLDLDPAGKKGNISGSVLTVTLEGTRAFLVELQALVVFSKLAMPRRVVSGVDGRRVELLLAVLQKHCRLPFERMDVFVNLAGGLRIYDPAIDLGICLALFSSFKNIPLIKTVGIAEVGLLGELRNIASIDKRVKEAQKLGFKNIISTKTHKTLLDVIKSLE